MTEPPLNPSVTAIVLMNNGCYLRLALGIFVIIQDKTSSISATFKFNQILLTMRNVGSERIINARLANRQDRPRSPRHRPGSSVVAKFTSIVKIIHRPLVRQAPDRVLTGIPLSSIVAVEFIHKDRKEAMHPSPRTDYCAGA